MALKKGVCKNFDNCTLAEKPEIQEVDPSEFRCAECGRELYEYKEPPPPFPLKITLIIIAAVILLGGGLLAYFGLVKGCSDVEESVSLSLNKTTISLYVGESDTLKATVISQPEDAKVSVSFTSGNTDVVQVDNMGVMQAIAIGETTIIVVAWTPDGIADTAYVKVTVRDRPDTLPETISLNKEIVDFNVGDCDTLAVDVTAYSPDANVSVSFTSDNADVAQVNNLGIVQAIAEGETTINVIAWAKHGTADTAYVKVTVRGNEISNKKAAANQNKPLNKSSRISFGTLDGSLDYDNDAIIKVTRQHTIKLNDAKQSIVTLYPGDVLRPCRIRKGVLESFQIIRKNGNRQSIIDSQEKLN